MKRDKKATRKRLMEAFWQLYCEKDVGKITVTDITNETGHYRSTFYLHFLDVYDVLEQLENEIIESIITNLPKDVSLPLEDKFISNISRVYELNGEYINVLLGDNGNPRFFNKLKNSLKPFVLEQFENSTDKDIKNLVFEYSISGIIYTIKYWYDNGKEVNSEDLLILIRNILSKGSYQVLKDGF